MNRAVKEQETTLGAWGDDLKLVLRPSGVAILSMNAKGGVNALSSLVISYFGKALDFVKEESSIKALVLASDKPRMFVAGADIHEILRTQEVEVALDLTRKGQEVLTKLLQLEKPVIAAVDGICLGAGVELILCCDKRIATDRPSTIFGLPEINIGLIPGLGGTQRLSRLIGLKTALEIVLSGEPITAQRALAIGLLDKIVSENDLLETASAQALELIEQKFDRSKIRAEQEARAEEGDGGLQKRLNLLKISDRAIRTRLRGLYAPPKIAMDAMTKGFSEGLEAGLKLEAESFAQLAVSQTAKNMINLYISKEMSTQLARRAREKVGDVTTLGIIGSGQMGVALAELAIQENINIIMKGSSEEKSLAAVDRLAKRAQIYFAETKKEQPVLEAAGVMDELRPAQVIIEAVYEDVDLKNKVVFEVSRAVSGSCVIASNTSSFAISNLSQFSDKPERVVGLHFFNPIDRMPLVEVITHARTDEAVKNKAIAIVDQLGKIPVVVKDSPGFLVNRILTCLLEEAARMPTQGFPINWVEDTALNFGLPLSPLWLFDELGLSLCNKVTRLLYEKFGKRYEPPLLLDHLLSLGLDGKKTLGCVYLWDETGKRLGFNMPVNSQVGIVESSEKPDEETATLIRDRLILPMVDEAARCLEEGIVRKARDIDLAMVLGIAFPRFRGGLLRYADDLGIDYVVERLNYIYSKYEPAREVSQYLLNLQKEGRRFYGLRQD